MQLHYKSTYSIISKNNENKIMSYNLNTNIEEITNNK